MSPFDKPEIPADVTGVTGPTVSPSVESELMRGVDVQAVRQFFQPTGAEASLPPLSTGGESAALSAKAAVAMPSFEGAALGAAGQNSAAAMAAKEVISPVVQLILRLPGVLGAGQSFFEFLATLFMPGGNLMEAFNPTLWANQLAGGIASLKSSLLQNGMNAAGEHIAVPLSMLPANAPIFAHLGAGLHGSGMFATGDLHSLQTAVEGLSNNGVSLDHLNVSGPLDLKKAQFEGVGRLSGRLDGLLSGPSVNPDFSASHLSGAQRLFSDQTSGGGSLFANSSSGSANTTVVSASGVPAGNSHLNIGSNSFNQEISPLPAAYRLSDGAISGPGMSGNVGYQLSGAQPALDNAPRLAPSGRVSDMLGGGSGEQLIAQNNLPEYYRPSMNTTGYPADAGITEASGSSGGLTGLRAEPLSILKKPVSTNHQGAMDQIGHQSKGSLSHHQGSKAVDQISHRTTPKAYSHSKVGHSAGRTEVHSAVPERAQMTQAQSLDRGQHQVPAEHFQQAHAGDAQIQPGSDASVEAIDYVVKKGDCLWDIAKKHLGDGSRWTEIYKLNAEAIGSNPDLIHCGLELKLPGADSIQTAGAGQYAVKPGDNLWDIAHDQLGDGTRWGEIYRANTNVIGDNPRLIFPGQQLTMPGQPLQISQLPAQAAPSAPMALQSAPIQIDPSSAVGQQIQQMHLPQQPPQTISMADPLQAPAQVQMPTNPGPGAAIAGTLDAPRAPVVSSSLAPDLSFLGPQKQQ